MLDAINEQIDNILGVAHVHNSTYRYIYLTLSDALRSQLASESAGQNSFSVGPFFGLPLIAYCAVAVGLGSHLAIVSYRYL